VDKTPARKSMKVPNQLIDDGVLEEILNSPIPYNDETEERLTKVSAFDASTRCLDNHNLSKSLRRTFMIACLKKT